MLRRREERTDEEFERVFRALFPRARKVAYQILGSETEAEDAAAEAFARAHASWTRVGGLPHRDAWLLRVTSNVAIDMVRRRRDWSAADPPVVEGPEDLTVLRVALTAALSSLPKRQREVIVLHYLAGLPEADVATCLRISAGTVKKTTHRAKAALRERLGDDRLLTQVMPGTNHAAL